MPGKPIGLKIPDFASNDIKGVWELSRFAWVYPLIWAWQVQKNDQAAEVFWDLVEDWVAHNPPNKFFDYISSGLPVVNNYPGWLADMITQHQCGTAVPPRNPEAFADALCHLADNPDLRKTCGQNARHLAEQQFSRQKLSSEFADFLEKST